MKEQRLGYEKIKNEIRKENKRNYRRDFLKPGCLMILPAELMVIFLPDELIYRDIQTKNINPMHVILQFQCTE